jgi:bifunctional N-acetylglucosamine-1-phosphate-uridyltransferase/glucosamine-1-phosphate-acetyltransferase GlmU-like protein
MVMYVVETAMQVAGRNVILVVGNQAEKVQAVVTKKAALMFALQEEQLGTGHAVLCALPQIPSHIKEVVILCGDVPLIRATTVIGLVNEHLNEDRDVSLLAVDIENPHGYGRILFDQNRQFCGIVEESEATEEQRRITLINSGIYCIKKDFLDVAMPHISSENAQGEIYLTDIIEIGYSQNRRLGVRIGSDPLEVFGINTIQDLERVESIMKKRMRIKT